MELMESYSKELKNENYLSRFGQARHSVQVSAPESNPVYVGSEKCKKCHEGAYDVWKNRLIVMPTKPLLMPRNPLATL